MVRTKSEASKSFLWCVYLSSLSECISKLRQEISQKQAFLYDLQSKYTTMEKKKRINIPKWKRLIISKKVEGKFFRRLVQMKTPFHS